MLNVFCVLHKRSEYICAFLLAAAIDHFVFYIIRSGGKEEEYNVSKANFTRTAKALNVFVHCKIYSNVEHYDLKAKQNNNKIRRSKRGFRRIATITSFIPLLSARRSLKVSEPTVCHRQEKKLRFFLVERFLLVFYVSLLLFLSISYQVKAGVVLSFC